jgi:hypothetical protein
VSALLRPRRPSPALVLGALALFFAVGGSAFAVGQAVAPQARCANGAVKGFAVVNGDPTKGIENTPTQFTSAAVLFGPRFNCTGGAVQVRKLPGDVGYAVLFKGVNSKVATAAVVGSIPGAANVTPLPDGSFQVVTAGNQLEAPQGSNGQFIRRIDLKFLIVVY